MSLIEIGHLTAGYGRNIVIEDISLSVQAGELVGVLGINGSGKSTLVKAICSVMPHTGTVKIGDRILEEARVREAAKMVSYVPQKSGVAIDIPVLDVVMMGFNPWISLLGRPDRAMEEKAKAVLARLSLSEKLNANYMELSEGQKQLTILARALVSESQLLLMDEPESALDFGVRYRAMEIVREWIKVGERAGLVVLHDIALALNCCDRLVLLKNKKMTDVIDLQQDSVESIEEKLRHVYGDLTIQKVGILSGMERFAVLYDSEEK